MKSWLVFLGGGVCGAVVALGVTRIFFADEEVSTTRRDHQRGLTSMARETAVGAQVKSDGRGEGGAGAELAERVAALQAWTDGRGTEPTGDTAYETLAEWSERDPQAALAWVLDAKRLPRRMRMMALPLAALAKKNPAEAAQWMRQHVGSQDRAEVLDAAFQFLANSSPQAALELALAFPEQEQPGDLGDALGGLMEDSPAEALAFFNRLTGERRLNSARWMLASWARKDAAAALAWASGEPDVIGASQVRWAFLEECAQSRPDLCVEFLKKFPNTEDPYNDSRAISVMLEKSVEHGLAALALAPVTTAESALTMWAQENFERSPERAVELVRKWVSEKQRSDVIRNGFHAWLESDQRAAMEWLGGVTEAQLRVTLQTGVIAWQAQRDPESALAVLNGPQAASPELRDVVQQALMNWAHRDVAAAAGWMVANPELMTGEQAAEVTAVFLSKDEEAGADWLAKLPAGAARDSAVEAAARHWAAQGEPELAVQVASSIRDVDKRTRAFFSVYNALQYTDAAAAEKWLMSAQELSEETKQSWRSITGGR